jgi:hypothetical protein
MRNFIECLEAVRPALESLLISRMFTSSKFNDTFVIERPGVSLSVEFAVSPEHFISTPVDASQLGVFTPENNGVVMSR